MRLLPLSLLAALFWSGLLVASLSAAPPGQEPATTPVPTLAATPTPLPNGVITGQVINGTSGQPADGLSVTLRRWQQDVELPPLTTSCGPDGSFRFEALSTDVHAFYRAEAVYRDVVFSSDTENFAPGTSQRSLPVTVYETTDDPQVVRIERFHFIVLALEPGFLSVLEMYQFKNDTDRAYVGNLDGTGQRRTVRMALPAGAQELTVQSGALGADFLAQDGELVATLLLVPGQAGIDAIFSYRVPYSGPSLELGRSLHYNTDEVNGLVADVGATLHSPLLAFADQRTFQGQNFLRYTGRDLKAGVSLPLRLDDLDQIQFVPSISSEDVEVMDGSTATAQLALLWAMLILGGLVVAFSFVYAWLRRRVQGEAPNSQTAPALERQRLLLLIARLDEAYQAQQMSETVYRRARAHRKAQLAQLWRQGDET